MKFHVLTLFPDMVMQGLMTSITGRAVQQKKIDIDAVNIRDYTQDKHGRVDDYPYGGGAGMLMQAQPVYDACQSVMEKIPQNKKKRVIYVTPQGIPFTQAKARELAAQDELLLLCGHYEGIDERVLEEVVTDYISIGDYVLTGGELAAMVIVDAVARLVPGVLGNEQSALTESFHGELMPFTSDEIIEKLENRIAEIDSVTMMLERGLTPEGILEEILGDFGLEITDKIPAAFVCDCSKERVSRALSTLSKKDLDDIINDGESIEVKCQFCNKAYEFSVEELKELRK